MLKIDLKITMFTTNHDTKYVSINKKIESLQFVWQGLIQVQVHIVDYETFYHGHSCILLILTHKIMVTHDIVGRDHIAYKLIRMLLWYTIPDTRLPVDGTGRSFMLRQWQLAYMVYVMVSYGIITKFFEYVK